MTEPLKITSENAPHRIQDAIETIIRCWDEWEAFAGEEEQQQQSIDAWFAVMDSQLRAVVEGMVYDAVGAEANRGTA